MRDFIRDKGATHAVATVRQYLWAISREHRAAGLAAQDPTETEAVKLAMRALARRRDRRPRQARALNREAVDRMLDAAGRASGPLKAKRDAALLSTAYDTMCRRSEIADMLVGHIAFPEPPNEDGAVLVPFSKTNQTADGDEDWRFLSAETLDLLCAWFDAAGIDPLDPEQAARPVFRPVNRHGGVRPHTGDNARGRPDDALWPEDVRRVFRALARAAGLPLQGVGGHSTRVGGAQDLVAEGHALADIAVAGGWRDPKMVIRYAGRLAVRDNAMAKAARSRRAARARG